MIKYLLLMLILYPLFHMVRVWTLINKLALPIAFGFYFTILLMFILNMS